MTTTANTIKKRYEKPTTKVYDLRPQRLICTSAPDWYKGSHWDRHLGMGACFHGNFFAIFLMVS